MSVRPSTFVKKWPLEYQIVTKTYLPSNLCDSSDSSDTCNSSDSSYRKKNFNNKTFFLQFFLKQQNLTKNQIVMKLKNSNCDKTLKLQLWWNSQNSNCD